MSVFVVVMLLTGCQDWSIRGGVVYDYLRLRSTVNKLKRAPNPAMRVSEKLRDEIRALAERVKSWSIPVEKNDRILTLCHTAVYDAMRADLHQMTVYINQLTSPVKQPHVQKKENFDVALQFASMNLTKDHVRGQLETLTSDFLSNFCSVAI